MVSLLDLPMQDVLREIAEHMPGHASVWDSVRRAFEERDAARARLAKVEPVVEAALEVRNSSYSGDDVRLLAVGLGGIIAPEIHTRCDRMNGSMTKLDAALRAAQPDEGRET